MAKEWSISGGAGDATIGSDGKAVFPKNSGTTDITYTITYKDDNGCTASTTYTVKSGTTCQPTTCQSAFTYSTVSGCIDWSRYKGDGTTVSAETKAYVITGESKDCDGNYKEVTFSCAEGPNTLWTCDVTHTGTSYTAKVYRKWGVYNPYLNGVPATLTNGQGEHYLFSVCTTKLTVTVSAKIVDQNGRLVSEWEQFFKPTAYGVKIYSNGVPLDDSATFNFNIELRGADGATNPCPQVGGHRQYKGMVTPTITAGSTSAYDTYPASGVAWLYSCEDNPSGECVCFPPFEYYSSYVAIIDYLTSQVETNKYILKLVV